MIRSLPFTKASISQPGLLLWLSVLLVSRAVASPGLSARQIDEPPAKASLRAVQSGLYVCADLGKQGFLLADRVEAAGWETFSIKQEQDRRLLILASNGEYVGTSDAEKQRLRASFNGWQDNCLFSFEYGSAQAIFVKSIKTGKYLRIDEQNYLVADASQADAAQFRIERPIYASETRFQPKEAFLLLLGLLLLLVSIILFHWQHKYALSLGLLVLGAFCLRLFMASLDMHLSWWDEQYHALVAKNMIANPFKPMLYKEALQPYDYRNWTFNHIWLHKQPLFLWQMALSMKVFGVNVLAMRLPSAVMSSLVVAFIYRVGHLSLSRKAGYYGGLLFATAYFTLEIGSGAIHTDHNDIAFLFYVSASIWAWVEYEQASPAIKPYFVLLIGLFSGAAILVKWLTGLLVFAAWGLSVILNPKRRLHWQSYLHMLVGVLVGIFAMLPWQLYVSHAFPLEAAHEYAFNSRHFFDPVEGHGGDFWYHFGKAETIYGLHAIILGLLLIFLARSLRKNTYRIGFIGAILIIYLFFGLAATKMIAFTYCVAMLLYLALGCAVEKLFERLSSIFKAYGLNRLQMPLVVIMLLAVLYLNLDLPAIRAAHTMQGQDFGSFFYERSRRVKLFNKLEKILPNEEKTVVFNCKNEDAVPIMFHSDVAAAYGGLPEAAVLKSLKEKGYTLAFFDDKQLPDYLLNDQEHIILQGYWDI